MKSDMNLRKACDGFARRPLWRLVATVVVASVPFVVSRGQAVSAEYFFSPNGDDQTGKGTRAEPWHTLGQANSALRAGDTGVFLDGDYFGTLSPDHEGAPGQPITYRAANPGRARLRGPRPSDAIRGMRLCVRITDNHYITLDGFTLDCYDDPEQRDPRLGWMLLEGANHCNVLNCVFRDTLGVAVRCVSCEYNRYENNRLLGQMVIRPNGMIGGDLWSNFGARYCVFEGNYMTHSGHNPLVIRPTEGGTHHVVIRRNVFSCETGRNFAISGKRLLFEDNIFTNSFDSAGSNTGWSKALAEESIWRRNLVYRNYDGTLRFFFFGNVPETKAARCRVYHNVFYYNNHCGLQLGNYGGEQVSVVNNVFTNNIIYCNDAGGQHLGIRYCDTVGPGNVFRNNVLCGDQPGRTTVFCGATLPQIDRWEGLFLTTAEAQRQRPEQFQDNLDVVPGFVDEAGDDFRLAADSPCIDAGRPLACAVEAVGNSRVVVVDDAGYFYDGFGVPGEQGDWLHVGTGKTLARVVKADVQQNRLELDRPVTCAKGEPVTLAYAGKAPDIGAYEFGTEQERRYAARLPEDLRVPTMEEADKPVIVVSFEEADRERWHHLVNEAGGMIRLDPKTAYTGEQSLRIFASGETRRTVLAAYVATHRWDIDRFPIVRFAYRIPPGVPIGLWLTAFDSSDRGSGRVCIGGTAALELPRSRRRPTFINLDAYKLLDDDRWHTIDIDARVIRRQYTDVKLLRRFEWFAFYKVTPGQQFWIDDFAILPAK
jgi:hypothetical protein